MGERQLRVLMPQRFDVLSRSMDTSIVAQWLGIASHCELVLWGPGLDGFVAGMALGEVARALDADVVLIPDMHQALPGLWDELWYGVEDCTCPIAWHFSDHGSAVPARRAAWERIRPAVVISPVGESSLHDYFDLRDALGTRIAAVPWGFDSVQFHPPAGTGERDIDILVAGAEEPEHVYRVRKRVKSAARSLAGEYRVLELGHPGYWETTGFAAGRGQAQYAELLRRSRLATTGTAFGAALTRKYWESAGCGAVGVGDLPRGERDSERFDGAILAVGLDWEVERIAEEMRGLLADQPRRAAMSAAAVAAVRGCDHRERARDYVAVLEGLVPDAGPRRRPLAFTTLDPIRKLCAAAEPAAVPAVRSDWRDAWHFGADGASRTRRVELALEGDEDVAVIAFDPDAALEVDAVMLAGACRCSGGLVLRPGELTGGDDPTRGDWSAVAAPREALRQALADQRGRCGLERALLELGAQLGWQILPGPGYSDPAGSLLRLVLHPDLTGLEHALRRALAESRHTTARELAGLACRHGWCEAARLEATGELTPSQDPELELLDGAAFTPFDPRDSAHGEAILAHARLGAGAPPLQIGVPLSAGLGVPDALSLLTASLGAAGVDTDACAQLAIFERPLFECEIAFLNTRLRRAATLGAAAA